ncbi:sulfate transport system ATP-binding protein [Verrucomicrobium sp. GAS474]|nr:ATP-binding cassette domain-containing protein [Verrucomicrobium sp. GAS474]SDT87141.1 sulfate transport system ATP-binding protein [Verrucomicrobium sp. GAS474]
MSIRITAINKTFGKFAALRDIDLEIRPGELLALLGPSGSGKTTLLRIIAGLESPDDGPARIEFDGVDVTTKSAYQRKAGFVFQHYALFQHMNVFENIAFGLRVRPRKQRPDEAGIAKRVRELLELIHLTGYEQRFPTQLSGGQRQRIALARALAIEPQILLLDEPFGALDARVRLELCKWLRTFHDETKITSLFVTHDQEEAFRLADRVVIFGEGRIRQIGTPEEVRSTPADDFVRAFIGFGEDLHPGAMV